MRPLLSIFALLGLVSVAGAQPPGDVPLPIDGPLKAQFQLNADRFAMPAVSVGTDIYVIDGYVGGRLSGSIERIDTTTHKVITLTTKLVPRGFCTAEAVGDSIYIFGGLAHEDGAVADSETGECFNTKTQQVTSTAPMPTPLRSPASVAVNGKIYVIGGSSEGTRVNLLFIYDPKTDKWTQGTPMKVARECDVVAKDGVIYAVGGFDGQSAVAGCEAYDIASNKWRDLPDLPVKTSAHHLAISNDAIWSFGDYADLDRVLRYDFKTAQWQRLFRTGYDGRRHTAVCMMGNEIYVMGGNKTTAGPYLDEVQVFDAAKLK